MALIRRASTTLHRSLATYAKIADRETSVAALRLRGWKDQAPKRDAVAKRFEKSTTFGVLELMYLNN